MPLFLRSDDYPLSSESNPAVEFPVNLGLLGLRLGKMSNEKLFRFGMSNRHMCSPEANCGDAPSDVYAVQLREARAEWKRRNGNADIEESF
jgi:hypothetical protein